MSKATKSIAELSADAAVVIAEISKLPHGSLITYEGHFSKWLGRPVRNSQDMPFICTVRNRLLKDYDLVLSAVSGEGYRLLTPNEVVADNSRMQRARHAAKRRKQELAAVDLSQLGELEKAQWAARLTQSHLVIETSSDKSLKRIAGTVNGACEPLALAKALDAIKGNV